MTVRTRFAPSPTGYLHIGGVRTALFSWLYARHHGGAFLLRVEDTDRERSTPEAIQIILDGLAWLELDYDEGPFFQSQRSALYQETLRRLLVSGGAYYCYCSREELEQMRATAIARGEKPRYDGRCRDRKAPPPKGVNPVVRFRNPGDGTVLVDDLIQGPVTYSNSELDDLILARADGTPTYNFTVVVDDLDMRITHVIRGDDHLNNAPRQMNIFAALGVAPPRYAHIPLILGPDGAKLSKRHGAASVLQYREEGYLPEALLNYLVRLGWSHGDQEIFSRREMIELFDIAAVNKAAAAINPDKLLWLNQHYLREADNGRLSELLEEQFQRLNVNASQGPELAQVASVQKSRTMTLREMAEESRVFFQEFGSYDEEAAKKHLRPDVLAPLTRLHDRLAALEDWSGEGVHRTIIEVAEERGLKLGKLAQPLRVAVTGVGVSPGIDDTLRLLGREQTLARLSRALHYIEERALA